MFARHGYHALSVELVLREAELSRPTFYKYFDSVDAAIDVGLREVNDDLVESLLTAIASASAPYDKVEAGLLAWRAWGERQGTAAPTVCRAARPPLARFAPSPTHHAAFDRALPGRERGDWGSTANVAATASPKPYGAEYKRGFESCGCAR